MGYLVSSAGFAGAFAVAGAFSGAGKAAGVFVVSALPLLLFVLLVVLSSKVYSALDLFFAITARPMLLAKKIAVSMAVVRDKKLPEPEAPKTVPALPAPKVAPASAPLPCCNKISTTMITAIATCAVRISVSNYLLPNEYLVKSMNLSNQ